MAYAHISNLHKDRAILQFKEVYALEKIHGTSAHISWDLNRPEGETLKFYSGGEKLGNFVALFDQDALRDAFCILGHDQVVVFGEAYGGSQQKQAHRYGPNLKFVVFEVKIGDTWLNVPNAEDVAHKLGLEFVHYTKIPTTIEALDAARDAWSVQAQRNGVTEPMHMEGVVLRPLEEMTRNNACRIMAKYKRDEFRETKAPRVLSNDLEVLTKANAIAMEWVTEERLRHVLDKLPQGIGIEATGDVIRAMLEDVTREGEGEFVDSKAARKAISARTVLLFKSHLQEQLNDAAA